MALNPELFRDYSNETLALISSNATHFTLNLKNDADKELQRRAIEVAKKKLLIDDISTVSQQIHKGIRDNQSLPELSQLVENKNIDKEISNSLVQKIYKFHNHKRSSDRKEKTPFTSLFSGISGFFK